MYLVWGGIIAYHNLANLSRVIYTSQASNEIYHNKKCYQQGQMACLSQLQVINKSQTCKTK